MLGCLEAPVQGDCLPIAVVGLLSAPHGRPSAQLAYLSGSCDRAQVAAVVAFLTALEAEEKIELYPPEAFESGPVSKPLARAIEHWSRESAGSPRE